MPARAVVDANAIVRGLFSPEHPVHAHLPDAIAPELVLAEVASSLLKYVRAGMLSPPDAREMLDSVVRSPLELRPLGPLIDGALEAAIRLGISSYDACYLALADQEGCTLVTADHRLAAVAERAELVP